MAFSNSLRSNRKTAVCQVQDCMRTPACIPQLPRLPRPPKWRLLEQATTRGLPLVYQGRKSPHSTSQNFQSPTHCRTSIVKMKTSILFAAPVAAFPFAIQHLAARAPTPTLDRRQAQSISQGRSNCGVEPCLVFDPTEQFVSTTGDHVRRWLSQHHHDPDPFSGLRFSSCRRNQRTMSRAERRCQP